MLIQLRQDMLMLENQLPLFVLERLLELQLGIAYKKGDAALLIAKFFRHSGLTTLTEEPWPTEVLLSIKGSLHCLDVFRECILKKCWIEKDVDERRSLSKCPSQKQHYIHCLTTLRKVGIKFKKRENCRFWDIKFNGGVLEIPQLYIYYDTKSLLLNLIAFEKCHPECIKNVTCYVLFMDNLIKSAKDVAYLRSRGIITGLESNAEVADLFNGLCKEIVFSGGCSYLCELSRDVNWYFNLKYKFASLKHKFANDPWAIFFTGAAVSFLLLTFFAHKLYVLLYG
ncbi:hypothetical protein FH972_004051 [Carpinus fangiana]|uniref:Uncharacterized protein n=1 Tax=Carpinus fangiana TaxID=176857 RepID=A0A5N6QMP1_9ROSI|nr:hypothetical protein FH972_004051 [Carpinus fangiana]